MNDGLIPPLIKDHMEDVIETLKYHKLEVLENRLDDAEFVKLVLLNYMQAHKDQMDEDKFVKLDWVYSCYNTVKRIIGLVDLNTN